MGGGLGGFERGDLGGEIILVSAEGGEDGWGAGEGVGCGEDGVEVGDWVVVVCVVVLDGRLYRGRGVSV